MSEDATFAAIMGFVCMMAGLCVIMAGVYGKMPEAIATAIGLALVGVGFFGILSADFERKDD